MDKKRLREVKDAIRLEEDKGSKYYALLCPFCGHKTPSLAIDNYRGRYDCRAYGCNKRGFVDDLFKIPN